MDGRHIWKLVNFLSHPTPFSGKVPGSPSTVYVSKSVSKFLQYIPLIAHHGLAIGPSCAVAQVAMIYRRGATGLFRSQVPVSVQGN